MENRKKIRPLMERPRHPETGMIIDGEISVTMDKGFHRMVRSGEIEVVEEKPVRRRQKNDKPEKGE